MTPGSLVRDRAGWPWRLVAVDGNTGTVASVEFPDPPGTWTNRRLETRPLEDLEEARAPVYVSLADGSSWRVPTFIEIPQA